MANSENTRKAEDRAARRAASLRRNLQRRKAQDRSRHTAEESADPSDITGGTPPQDSSPE